MPSLSTSLFHVEPPSFLLGLNNGGWCENNLLQKIFSFVGLGPFHLFFTLSCDINSIGYVIDGTRQL